MPTGLSLSIADTLAWGVTWGIAVAIARAMYRQRAGQAAHIFLYMVMTIGLPLTRNMLCSLIHLIIKASAYRIDLMAWYEAIYHLWPIDDAAVVLFAALWLHFFLTFPSPHPVLKRRGALVALYAPAVLLALAWLGHLVLPEAQQISNEVLDGLGVVYITLVFGLGLIALGSSYRGTVSPVLRMQARWLIWGMGMALVIALVSNWLPGLLDIPRPSDRIPGLEQLPLLLLLSTFAMGIVRYRGLDIDALIYNSLVLLTLAAGLTGLYLLLTTALPAAFHTVPDWPFFLSISLLIAIAGLPGYRILQTGFNLLLRREHLKARRLLEQSSRRLIQTKTLPEVIEHITRVIEATLQPAGLALVLRRGHLWVTESCQGLPLTVGQRYPSDVVLATWLTTQRRPLYLPMETEWVFSLEAVERRALEESGVSLYIPLLSEQRLNGWLALGPRPHLRAYTPADLEFLVALSDRVNVALQVTRLIRELEQRVSQLAVLNETGQLLSASLRTEELLDRTYQQVNRLMEAGHLHVALYDPDKNLLSFPLVMENNRRQLWASRPAGQGLLEYVIRTRQPLLIPRDVKGYATRLGLQVGEIQARSWLGVPLMSGDRPGDQVLGAIVVQNLDREEAYTEDDQELLSTIASQAAIAIANARLYERTDQALERRINDLSKLYEASLMLAFSTETQDVLQRIGEMACEITGSDSTMIYLYHQERDAFTPVAAVGATLPEDRGANIRPSGMTRRALLERRSFVVADTALEPDLNPTVRQTGIRSLICMPLISKGQPLGVMYVNSTQPNKYSENDVQLISAMAGQAAVAIENGQLFKHLAEGRDRLQAVLDATREGLMMLDTSGRIVFANAMFGELFNAAPASLTGRRLLDVIAGQAGPPDETLAAMMDVIYETLNELAGPSEGCSPDQLIHKSMVAVAHPPRFIERISSPVFDEAGNIIGRLLALRDVTEEKKSEALREDLTRMMVHDLRSPLTGVLGSLQVLEMSLTDDYLLQAVRIALSSSHRLLGLINALLDISKMEDGRMPLRCFKVPWPKMAQEAVERVRPMATNERITVQLNLADELPPVYADENIMVRVLVNLLDNAIKFSPPGATVQLTVRLSEKAGPSRETLCQVCDTGPGIPPEYHERIFDKFFQVPDNTARRRGSGLGLAFCRLAVEAHGGRLWVESTPGQGSTFFFTLPVGNEEESS